MTLRKPTPRQQMPARRDVDLQCDPWLSRGATY